MDAPRGRVEPLDCPPNSLLLVTHVPLRRAQGALYLDDQTCQGLERWSQSFETITFMGLEEDPDPKRADGAGATTAWRCVETLRCASRLSVRALPNAYRVRPFASHYLRTRRVLAHAVRTHRYLCFTLGSLVGDWGGIAALESARQNRAHAVWFDRVEHEVIRRTSQGARLRRRIKNTLVLPLMIGYHRRLIARSTLGLFQGQDTFGTYAPYSRLPCCVYDTHTTREDGISPAALEDKCAAIRRNEPLRVVYVGRATAMKGALDWVDALHAARHRGARFTATWWGDGPQWAAMRERVAELDLADCVELPGFEDDRARLLAAVREADLFVFCHRTPESPRCLIEALVCGAPIVGYGSRYAEDLVARDGGGRLCPADDPSALADLIVEVDRHRDRLCNLVRAAARTGDRFDEETVYRERAHLLRRHL
ncbi:glycosyltransferase [Methylobacterium sp. NEAU 140]|uniref:glycosyltransferase n=1 Tax=Methylobacterium sp. NEAU 140 TaxID=3064945 RepID=UPI00273626D3|nr:glycosyltransferase [Methylobacterium sp. NEAU 140]MDP4023739.1 glycosyltransferase [Methylobacterium sp. NEAU 140]